MSRKRKGRGAPPPPRAARRGAAPALPRCRGLAARLATEAEAAAFAAARPTAWVHDSVRTRTWLASGEWYAWVNTQMMPKLAGKAAAPTFELSGTKLTFTFTAVEDGFVAREIVPVAGFNATPLEDKKIFKVKLASAAKRDERFEIERAILRNRG